MKTYEVIFSKLTECETYVGFYETRSDSYYGKIAVAFSKNSSANHCILYFWEHHIKPDKHCLLDYRIIKIKYKTRNRSKLNKYFVQQ